MPSWLGLGPDTRCLSFKVQGVELTRTELYDLGRDPEARRDLSFEQPDVVAGLAGALERHIRLPVAEPAVPQPSDETLERLRALGYLDGASAAAN